MLQLCTQQGTDAQCWVALRKKTSAECGKMAALQGIFPSEGTPEGAGCSPTQCWASVPLEANKPNKRELERRVMRAH